MSLLFRRHLLAGVGMLAAGRAWAQADSMPRALTLVVAGPSGGRLDRAASALLAGLQGQLPAGTPIGRSAVGGLDGVTGANRFNASADTDGGSALLLPAAAPMAWLVGDRRVHYDPAEWVPVLAGAGPAVVVARRPVRVGSTLRVAAGDSSSPALAGLLALDLLGVHVQPVGPMDEASAAAALRVGGVDAMLVTSGRAMQALAAVPGLRVLFRCGPDGQDGVPGLASFAGQMGRVLPQGAHFRAWEAAAAAARLRYALVLQQFSAPAAVALWRGASSHALMADLDSEATLLDGPDAARLIRGLTPDSAALLDLRGWIETKNLVQPA